MRPLSPQVKCNVVSLLQQGHSVERVAAELGLGRSTVSRIKGSALPHRPNLKSGRKKILSPTVEYNIVRAITSGRQDTASEVQKDLVVNLGIEVSQTTVRRCLKQHGLKAAVKKKKPLLKKSHIKKRLEFAERYCDWTLEDWKRVVWSDETKINRLGSDGRKWMWTKPGTGILPQHVQATVKHGGGNILIWDA